MKEDHLRILEDQGPENLAILRRIAHNLLKRREILNAESVRINLKPLG